MSGIAGIYFLDGRPVERAQVDRMVESIAHRGPDGFGVWTDGSVGLGHRMLRTTPESLNEKLPLTNRTGNLVITADARIDNRDELIPALHFNGRRSETIANSEIILAAYERWEERCPERLLGDFSFALWDKQRQRLYCARDPIGIKPFFYYFDGKVFLWASEPQAIFEGHTILKEPNLTQICLYLLDRFDNQEETLYRNIYRLPPSHFMVLENGQLRKGQYWDIDPNYSVSYKTDEEYAEHYLELFKEAVRARLRSHGPVGALLSGGLDSSSVVCTAQMLYQEKFILQNRLETFSLVFDELPCDERHYIEEVVHKWEIKAHYIPYEKNLSWVDFEQVYRYPDIIYGPTLLSYGPALKDAQEKGIRIMLDGIGGDDLLAADITHLTDLMLEGNIRKLMMQLRCDASLYSCSPYSLFFNYCLKPLIPQPMKAPLKKLLKPFRRNAIPPLVTVDCLKKNGVSQRLQTRPCGVRFPTRTQQRIYELLHYGWNTNIALDTVERFNAYFSIEGRHPFLDRRLVEFAIGLPEEQRWCNEWPKAVLRRAMEGILPEPIRKRRGKTEFSSTIDKELKQRQANKLDELLRSSILARLGVIHPGGLKQLVEKYRFGSDQDDRRNALEVVIWLELWYRSVMGVS